ncbi:MAG: LytR family transcriptional regulator [Firmicutes bacterium]|nr:LytR family transcriptional regulator [Bacillota bacterium]
MTGRRRRRNKSNKRLPLILAVIASLVVFAVAYGVTSGGYFPWPSFGDDQTDNGDKKQPQAKAGVDLPGFNVLLLGTDDREEGDDYSRTDTIIVLNYNDEAKRMSMLSIPRDSRVQIPGSGLDKINAANVYGGPELAAETVSQLIGVNVDKYILTNFYGFKDIVDALGGVTLNVEKNMYKAGEQSYGGRFGINLKKGEQRLDGDKALQYVRFRGDGYGDITRTGRQLKFLKALGNEVMQAKTITKLPKLIPELMGNIETNLGPTQLLQLAKAGKNLDNVEMVTQTLPGHFLENAQGSFWAVDQQQAKRVALALFEDGKVLQEVVQGPTEDLRPEPEPEEEDKEEVMLSKREGEANGNDSTSSEQQDTGGDNQEQPAENEEPASANNTAGQNEEDNTEGAQTPANNEEQQDNVDESVPPEGLPVMKEIPEQNKDSQVKIIIDVNNGGAST